jgi:hypothetical protein
MIAKRSRRQGHFLKTARRGGLICDFLQAKRRGMLPSRAFGFFRQGYCVVMK